MVRRMAAGLLVVGVTAACGGSSGPVFTAGATTATCLEHQRHAPTKAYEGGTSGQSEDVLAFLAYYTAHGDQPFCDNKKSTSHDTQWGKLYVRLTGNPDKVGTVLTG